MAPLSSEININDVPPTAPQIKAPIKQDLFRFATLRAPQQIDEESIPLYFVTHPDPSQSQLLGCPYIGIGQPVDMPSVQSFMESSYGLPTDSFLTHPKMLNTNFEQLYNFSLFFNKRKGTISEMPVIEAEFARGVPYPLPYNEKVMLFDMLMFEVIFNTSSYRRQAVNQILIMEHALNQQAQLPDMGINKIQDIKIALPEVLVNHVNQWRYNGCSSNGETHGVENLGVIVYRKVEQEVCCYTPGEVSHIENIMAREYKVKTTRNYIRSENTIETSRESEIEDLSDVTTATRNQMSTETVSVRDEMRSFDINASASYNAVAYSGNISTGFAMSNATSVANTVAQQYAQEITERALERIVQKTSEKRTSKIIKEFEEENKHGFDNRGGSNHITGIYRWIDIIYKNRLVNYGKRMVVEFAIPEPAKLYKWAMNKDLIKVDTAISSENLPPQSLEERGIFSPDNIDTDNYLTHSLYYGANVTEPLQLNITRNQVFQGAGQEGIFSLNFNFSIEPNYRATNIDGFATFFDLGKKGNSSFNVAVSGAGAPATWTRHDNGGAPDYGELGFSRNFGSHPSGSFSILVGGSRLSGPINLQVKVYLTLQESVISDWKLRTYQSLQSAYEAKLAAYEMTQAQSEGIESDTGEIQSSNPALNRITEQRELKRAAIELITKPFCRKQGFNFFNKEEVECDPDGVAISQITQTAELASYMKQVKFMEQVFDWGIMSYKFQPYYWANKCDWAALLQTKSDDLLFQAFLQSGMAKVTVPVTPGFEAAVCHYLKTGDVWMGGDTIPSTMDTLYESLIRDLATADTNEDIPEWETRVPTTMAIIQGRSAYLNNDGLPCCHSETNPDDPEGEQIPTSDVLPWGGTLRPVLPRTNTEDDATDILDLIQ